jgi:hypothetical protein
MYGAFIASLSAITLMLAANETFARPGAAPHGGFRSAHAASHRLTARSLRHHRGEYGGVYWTGDGDYSGPSNGEPIGEAAPGASGDIHYTYTRDVPWDWAHRYPPAVAPSDRPYVPSCPTETATVPGRDGTEHTINITRCF